MIVLQQAVFILTVSEENMGCLVFSCMRVFEVCNEGLDRLKKEKRVRLETENAHNK